MTRSAIRIVVAVVGVAVLVGSLLMRRNAEARLVSAEKQAIAESAEAARILASHHDVVSNVAVPPGTNFTNLLQASALDRTTANEIAAAVQPVFNLRYLRAGDKLTLVRSGTVHSRPFTIARRGTLNSRW